jgi:hypothetical protein
VVERVARAIRDTRKRIVARTNEWCVQEVTDNDFEFAKAAITALGDAPVSTVLQEAGHNQPSPASDSPSGYSGYLPQAEYEAAMADIKAVNNSDQREICDNKLIELMCDAAWGSESSAKKTTQVSIMEDALDAIRHYLRSPEPVSVDLEAGAKAIATARLHSIDVDRKAAKGCAKAWGLKWK